MYWCKPNFDFYCLKIWNLTKFLYFQNTTALEIWLAINIDAWPQSAHLVKIYVDIAVFRSINYPNCDVEKARVKTRVWNLIASINCSLSPSHLTWPLLWARGKLKIQRVSKGLELNWQPIQLLSIKINKFWPAEYCVKANFAQNWAQYSSWKSA